jgi:NAD(P)-dependent dehydrogenase (short-subunit alcohol dehydrogenase family)
MTLRTAIVTGGLTGIGLAAARALSAAGFRVAVGSRRGRGDPLAETAAATLGPEAHVGALDVRDQASVDVFVAEVAARLGPPLALVNAAGIFQEVPLDAHSDAPWDDQIDINLSGPFRMIRAVWPAMRAAGWGRIVNIASTNASAGAPGSAASCASKAGLVGLTKAVAVEGAPYGVTCVAISPTWVETPMMDAALIADGVAPEALAAAKEAMDNPQGRLIQPEEVGALAAFCCSDAAPSLTNADIQLNAGALI